MFKKIFALLLCALLLTGALSLAAFAEEGVVYISYAATNDNDGLTEATAKKSIDAEGVGCIAVIPNGGTIVACQKAYFGGNYTLNFGGPVTITGNYGGKDYKNPEPAENPASGVVKMSSGATLSLMSDLVLDDIIIFQENAQNTISVGAGATLVVTDSCVLLTKPGNDYHFKIVIEPGATAILSQAAQDTFDVMNIGGTLETYGAASTEKTEIKMTIGDMNGYVNGVAKALDAAPIIRQNRTMLPVRFVAENLGAAVTWDGTTSTATLTRSDIEIKITIGATTATVNGEEKPLDAPAFIENSRTYLPVRFVAEALGGTVAWDGATSTATITK